MFKFEHGLKKVSLLNWYLLQTKPNGHRIAQENLNRQGFKVFLPLLIKTSKNGTKFVNKFKPLFPGYIFFGTDLEIIPWKTINSTRGISKAVTLDGNYHSIEPKIIEGIKNRCNQNGILETIDSVKVGDRARIETGPFADFICNVEKIDDCNRAWVLLDILRQQIRATVSLNTLSIMN